ncbi:PREDICTED: cleavage stimulation factor subunit 50-like [Camelina sativa]|uniref:Cleavage stimulation factor 50 kDa subunit n=1 Tax=Camelina sativa TaxID=90675 RepID=A0ABM0VIT7_CAMSA|nr:PREDICTED: cleavage stimulation factor subunit 50-like [Camelina sativa]
MVNSGDLDQTLQDGNIFRQLNALIVAHLRHHNLSQAASTVASATMTPLDIEVPPNRLLELVAKGLAAENNGTLRDLSSSVLLPCSYGSTTTTRTASIDFSVTHVKGSSKTIPKHESKTLSEHKSVVRCARFSPDGMFFATGGADTSIKLFEVPKVKQMISGDTQARPLIRTFYDHAEPLNDLDFHPRSTILVSSAKDNCIKFFDFSKTTAKRAFKVFQDTHNVRSISFHPSGEFLLAGTDHPIPHLYDVNTYQCFLPSNVPDSGVNGAINQVRYSSTGSIYVTASKDGAIRLYDGVSAKCIRSISGAHGKSEVTSAVFTKDQRFVLSSGKDFTVKLWEVGSGRMVKEYLGAKRIKLRSQAIFNETEEFVISIDEASNEVVTWDARTAEKVARWPSNHNGTPRWIEHSPVESVFVTCGTDRSIRFWKESV